MRMGLWTGCHDAVLWDLVSRDGGGPTGVLFSARVPAGGMGHLLGDEQAAGECDNWVLAASPRRKNPSPVVVLL